LAFEIQAVPFGKQYAVRNHVACRAKGDTHDF
jgi:hypothetical protein